MKSQNKLLEMKESNNFIKITNCFPKQLITITLLDKNHHFTLQSFQRPKVKTYFQKKLI